METSLQHNIFYSCVDEKERENEQFVAEHALGYIVSGKTHFHTNSGDQIYEAETIGLVRRNQLIKALKVPPSGGQFKSINIVLDQNVLRRYSAENNITTSEPYTGDSMLVLSPNPFIKGYFDSLLPYFDYPDQLTKPLTELKTAEAIELLLRFNYNLKDFLFDFNDPH